MLRALRRWRRERTLQRHRIDDELWQQALRCFVFTRTLTDEEAVRLRDIVTLFLASKSLSAAGGHQLTDAMRVSIATQACILVLELGVEYYDGWVEVIVYPDEFIPEHTWTDEAGVVHHGRVPHMGQAWLHGPVILSWADVARAGEADGFNVVIHEFAHKLDMLNGDANGYPPLHKGMNRTQWRDVFSEAYERFSRKVRRHVYTEIDPYAAESPAEFFAVMSEAFFEIPDIVQADYPEVYEQLRQFYRQDPLARLPRDATAAGGQCHGE